MRTKMRWAQVMGKDALTAKAREKFFNLLFDEPETLVGTFIKVRTRAKELQCDVRSGTAHRRGTVRIDAVSKDDREKYPRLHTALGEVTLPFPGVDHETGLFGWTVEAVEERLVEEPAEQGMGPCMDPVW